MPTVAVDVKLRRNPLTGQVVYEDCTTTVGYVAAAVQRAAVIAAAGVPVPDGLYQRLCAVSESFQGRAGRSDGATADRQDMRADTRGPSA